MCHGCSAYDRISNLNHHRLKTEVDLMTRLDHSNIIKMYDVFEDERFLYIVMELCTGGYLIEESTNTMKENKSEKYGSEIMYQLLSALNHIHSQNIINGNIKPENIMFDHPNGNIKCIDFGLAS